MYASNVLEKVAERNLADYEIAEDISLDSDSEFQRADGLSFGQGRHQVYVFKLEDDEYVIDSVDQEASNGGTIIDETYSFNELSNEVEDLVDNLNI